ncbi:MAG: S-methyl-5'-thioinosine phosphorylase [Chromatiales bacterium]|nr:S-methyl-5'-thioinosine phosphorylase [Chromatiales bacterium]
MNVRLGIIGGTGSAGLFPGGVPVVLPASQPWGPASSAPVHSVLAGHEVIFLPRHGAADAAAIPPHRVNYRANLWTLRELGVDHVVAINAVGGIDRAAPPGRLVIPDQIIDYTWGREHTFTGDARFPLQHVDFTGPFTPALRNRLVAAAVDLGLDALRTATYGATQGPRLESAAEIDRLERDGCHVVGMTGMPEAGLARELGLSYAMCCVVVNHAAGRVPAGVTIHAQIEDFLAEGMAAVRRLIGALLAGGPVD